MRREDIISAINKTKKPVKKLWSLPSVQGIYAFSLSKGAALENFGFPEQVIYVGLAEKSLAGRDIKCHLRTGQTGGSSLRRSLGAVLRDKLSLTAIPRDRNGKKPRPDKYKFEGDGEKRLTDWMIENLELGFWANPSEVLTKAELRKEEEQVIKALQPTLDLDRRTKHLNPLAKDLDELREICRAEVRKPSEIN